MRAERERLCMEWGFRSPSTVCISASVICMQMAACPSEREAGGRDAFLKVHYPEKMPSPPPPLSAKHTPAE